MPGYHRKVPSGQNRIRYLSTFSKPRQSNGVREFWSTAPSPKKHSRSRLKVLKEHSFFYSEVVAIEPGKFPAGNGEPGLVKKSNSKTSKRCPQRPVSFVVCVKIITRQLEQ